MDDAVCNIVDWGVTNLMPVFPSYRNKSRANQLTSFSMIGLLVGTYFRPDNLNLWFSVVFREYRKERLALNGLNA